MVSETVVLVVDDAPQSLGLLCHTLQEHGYTVLVARDGQSALDRLDLATPDVVLLDAMMPGLSGFETCRRIKQDAALQHIPVIFMTGLSDTQDDCARLRALLDRFELDDFIAEVARGLGETPAEAW